MALAMEVLTRGRLCEPARDAVTDEDEVCIGWQRREIPIELAPEAVREYRVILEHERPVNAGIDETAIGADVADCDGELPRGEHPERNRLCRGGPLSPKQTIVAVEASLDGARDLSRV